MRIAVCDDDPLELERVTALLADYRRERDDRLAYQVYQSATELLSVMRCCQYDLLLLDILMPGFSGIEAAHEVRGFDAGVSIIFLTSSLEFAVESYAVKARDYMLKPVTREKLFSALDGILSEQQTPFEGLYLKTQTGMAHLLFSKLSVVEVANKHLYFYLADGSAREVSATLADYEGKLLARPEFIKVHRSYIVNMGQMNELTAGSFVTRGGLSVPISRLLYSEVRKEYMNYLFSATGVH